MGSLRQPPAWIDDAIERALGVVEHAGLDIRIVGHPRVSPEVAGIIDRWDSRERSPARRADPDAERHRLVSQGAGALNRSTRTRSVGNHGPVSAPLDIEPVARRRRGRACLAPCSSASSGC